MSIHSKKTLNLVYCAAFIAIAVILGYLSRVVNPFVNLPFLRFSLAPAVVIFAGAAMGWSYGAIVGAAADILTFLLYPTGAYFPAFTLTMALYGVFGAWFFYKKPVTIPRIVVGVVVIQTILSAVVNTLWNVALYGPLDPVKLGARLATSYTACAVFIVILVVLMKYKERIFVPAAN